MSNAAKFETPDAADNGKTYVYNSGTDAHVLTDMATQAELDAHTADTTDAHDASAISFVATGTIAGTDVQTAVAEVATDAAAALSTHEADTTSIHGITDTSTLYRAGGTDVAVADGGTGASTAADARTNLGLVIGTNVQAFDTDLTAIAALVSAADKVLYSTGAGTWALADLTAAGRALVDDADADAQLATLGAVDRENGGLETVSTNAAASGAMTAALSAANLFNWTLTGNITSITVTGATSGKVCSFTMILKQDATGGRAITWPAVKWLPAGAAPTFSTAANTWSIVELFTVDGGTTLFAALAGSGIA